MSRLKNYIWKLSVAIIALLLLSNCGEDDSYLEVSTDSIELSNSIRTGSFRISSDQSWSVSSSESWLKPDQNSGSGDATITVTAEENESAGIRTATITVSGGKGSRQVKVTQSGYDFYLDSYELDFDASGTPKEVTITTSHSWTIEKNDDAWWCDITPMSGSGSGKITFTPKPFTDREPRNQAMITIRYNNTFVMVVIRQEIPNAAPSAPVITFPANGSSNVTVYPLIQWQASVDPDGDDVFYEVEVSKNGTSWVRIADDVNTTRSYPLNAFLDKNTNYQCRVTAYDQLGASTVGEPVTFTTGNHGGYSDKEYWTLQEYSSGAGKPVHLIIVGDGFTFDDYIEGGAFEQAVNTAVEAFFSVEPFPTYRHYFTVTAVAAYSQEKGATVLNNFNNNGPHAQTKNTVFSSVFEGGSSTGISCDYEKVFDYARLIPDVTNEELSHTTVISLINLEVYAGTCVMYRDSKQSVSMCPLGSTLGSIVSHEAGGHGFGRLLDEYRYYDASLPVDEANRIVTWSFGDRWTYGANVTVEKNRGDVHWNHYFSRSNYNYVGYYEGACLYRYGVWRPEYNSCMNDNILYYNAPSREAIVRRIMGAVGLPFNVEEFINNDVYAPVSAPAAAFSNGVEVWDFVPLAPPILVNK